MTVSIIVPNYNHARYLTQRIDSILNQSYQDFELILLDDSSNDQSQAILESYRGHPKVRHLIFNTSNSGSVFLQWQKGISLSTGTYIWIAESDDYAGPHFLSYLVSALNSEPLAGIAYCDSSIVFDDGSHDVKTFGEYRNIWLSTSKWSGDYVREGRVEIAENLLQMCTINNASAVLFRRDMLVNSKSFDLPFRFIGDWYVYLKMCMKHRIIYINRPLNNYREHSENTFKKSRYGTGFVSEYFLLFDWVLKNITFIQRSVILSYFKGQTRHSLVKDWSAHKIQLYSNLFKVNPLLLIIMLCHNIMSPIRERIKVS